MPLDPSKTKARLALNHPSMLFCLAVDPATGVCYAGSADNAIHLFDSTGAKKEPIGSWSGHQNYVSALVAPTVAKLSLVSGGYDRQLIWWDTDTGKPFRRVIAHDGWVRDLAATPDGSRVISVGDDMLVKVWDHREGRLIRALAGHALLTPQGHVTALYAVAVSPDGKHLASGDRIGDVCVWELETAKLVQRLQTPILYTYDGRQRKRSLGGVRALAFTPDSNLLAVGGMGQVENVDGLGGLAHVEIWDWRKAQRRLAAGAEGHKGFVDHLLFRPDGSWLIGCGGGSDGGLLAFWRTEGLSSSSVTTLPTQRMKVEGHLRRLWLHPEKDELVTAGHAKLQVWSMLS